MTPHRTILSLGLGVLGALAPAAHGQLANRVRFELCGRQLASVEIGQFEGTQPWGVLVQLAPADAEAFRAATAGHAGATLDITHGGQVLVSGRISGEIRTGLITATYENKEDAERARAALREKSASVCENAPS